MFRCASHLFSSVYFASKAYPKLQVFTFSFRCLFFSPGFDYIMSKFTKKEIIDFLVNNTLDSTIHYIVSKLNLSIENISESDIKSLINKIRVLKSKRDANFQAAQRSLARFEFNNAEWLHSNFSVPIIAVQDSASSSHFGRPSLNFAEKSDRSKRREVSKISAELKNDPLRLIMACRYAAKQSANRDLYSICTSNTTVLINKN